MTDGESGAGRSVRAWLVRWLGGRRGRDCALDPLDPSMRVVARAEDEVESCSSVLERASSGEAPWDARSPALSRHHLRAPAGATARIAEIAAESGYTVYEGDVPPAARGASGPGGAVGGVVTLARTERLDALHLAQERARMAGLAQRYGGTVLGWDALQPGG